MRAFLLFVFLTVAPGAGLADFTGRVVKVSDGDTLEKLGADRFLLAAVGSWGDTLSDGAVLSMLREWNEKGRIELDEVYASTSLTKTKRRRITRVK